jgi:kynurenine formamidase
MGIRSLGYLWLCAFIALSACGSGDVSHLAEPKRIVDLSPALGQNTACQRLGIRTCDFLGAPTYNPFTLVTPADTNRSFGMMTFALLSHGGAHLDAPGRLLRDGARADQVPLDRLYGPARVWDLRWHDRHTPLQITDLTQQPSLHPGEVLLLITGYDPPGPGDWPVYAWLSPQVASWLAAQHPRALATDMPSIGSFERCAELLEHGRPPEEVWAEHLPFFQTGIPVIEGLINLEQLVGESTIIFAGLPLAIADRSGAPLRAVAFVY